MIYCCCGAVMKCSAIEKNYSQFIICQKTILLNIVDGHIAWIYFKTYSSKTTRQNFHYRTPIIDASRKLGPYFSEQIPHQTQCDYNIRHGLFMFMFFIMIVNYIQWSDGIIQYNKWAYKISGHVFNFVRCIYQGPLLLMLMNFNLKIDN